MAEYSVTGVDPDAQRVFDVLAVLNSETKSDDDMDYKPAYYFLFNGISDVAEKIINSLDERNTDTLIQLLYETYYKLQKLQTQSEDILITNK